MAPFTKAANKAIPARTITAVSSESIFSISKFVSSHTARDQRDLCNRAVTCFQQAKCKNCPDKIADVRKKTDSWRRLRRKFMTVANSDAIKPDDHRSRVNL